MCNPAISVVIPVRNEAERLVKALRSIANGRSHPFPLEIVVVDDASEDGCCDAARGLFSWARDRVAVNVIRLNRWSGIPYARNCGAFAARAEILFITDANVRFQRNWDVPIFQRLRPRLALCATVADAASAFRGYGCALELPSMGVRWLRSPYAFGGYVPVAPCTGTIVGAALFRQLGGYDTAMPVYGAAEPEFSVRLWLSGAAIMAAPDIVVTHRFRPAAEREPFLKRIAAIQVQNYLRFGLLYLAESQLIQVLRHYALSAPDLVGEAMTNLARSDVWSRRVALRASSIRSFDSFARRFGLLGFSGRLMAPASA
jgi:glycosyltransferase involved in cell wall biosynthesis